MSQSPQEEVNHYAEPSRYELQQGDTTPQHEPNHNVLSGYHTESSSDAAVRHVSPVSGHEQQSMKDVRTPNDERSDKLPRPPWMHESSAMRPNKMGGYAPSSEETTLKQHRTTSRRPYRSRSKGSTSTHQGIMSLLTAATLAVTESSTVQSEPMMVPSAWLGSKQETRTSTRSVIIDWKKGSELLKKELRMCANSTSKPVKFDERTLPTCFDYEVSDVASNPQGECYKRKSRPNPKLRHGIPWPTNMSSRTTCTDGSIMMVLDSAAEVSLVRQHDLLPTPRKDPLYLSSFMSQRTVCHQTGTIVGMTKSFSGERTTTPVGYGGVIVEKGLQDNLASVPMMRKLGYQFWFGEYPFMVTPNGTEVPLYIKQNGYLGMRIHPLNTTERKDIANTSAKFTSSNIKAFGLDNDQQSPVSAKIGYLSNDINLWHERFCHVPPRTLRYMVKNDLVHGLPKSFGTFGVKLCLTCGMGKSCCQHVGPTNHADKKKNLEDKSRLKEVNPQKYYPMEQLHLDTCEMDSPDIYGNKFFMVIVDRSTGFIWTLPLKTKENFYKIFDVFLKEVVDPYFFDKNKTLLDQWAEARAQHGLSGKHTADQGTTSSVPELPTLKNIRCDCGSEFVNKNFKDLLAKRGAKLNPTNAYVNDGRAEAAIKKCVTLTRCCLISSNLRKPFWGPIMNMVVHTLNRTYCPAYKAVPFVSLTGLKPDVSYFRMPGTISLCHVMDKYRRKLDDRAFVGILIGYDTLAKSWIFLNPKTGRNVRTIHARFYERSRDHQEQIDMSSMLLDPPSFRRELEVHGWKCQLWPRVLWPGMEVDRLGNTKPAFPDVNDSSREDG